jgi:hypothetical protein
MRLGGSSSSDAEFGLGFGLIDAIRLMAKAAARFVIILGANQDLLSTMGAAAAGGGDWGAVAAGAGEAAGDAAAGCAMLTVTLGATAWEAAGAAGLAGVDVTDGGVAAGAAGAVALDSDMGSPCGSRELTARVGVEPCEEKPWSQDATQSPIRPGRFRPK